MNHWASHLLEKIVNSSEVIDEVDLRDVEGLKKFIENCPLYPFRSPKLKRISEKLDTTVTLNGIGRAFWEIAIECGYSNCSMYIVNSGDSSPFNKNIFTSLSPELFRKYLGICHRHPDPVIEASKNTDRQFMISETQTKKRSSFWNEVGSNSIFTNGACFPISMSRGKKVAVCFYNFESPERNKLIFERHQSDLSFLSLMLSEAFLHVQEFDAPTENPLNLSELEFLGLLARCNKLEDVKSFTGPFGSNRGLQSEIRRKLGVETIFQAFAIAISNGWIEESPWRISNTAFVFEELAGWDFEGSTNQ